MYPLLYAPTMHPPFSIVRGSVFVCLTLFHVVCIRTSHCERNELHPRLAVLHGSLLQCSSQIVLVRFCVSDRWAGRSITGSRNKAESTEGIIENHQVCIDCSHCSTTRRLHEGSGGAMDRLLRRFASDAPGAGSAAWAASPLAELPPLMPRDPPGRWGGGARGGAGLHRHAGGSPLRPRPAQGPRHPLCPL